MKITIEIDGDQAQVTPVSGATGATTPTPPDVAARAQAIGAIDGGAAPSEPAQGQAPPIPATIPGLTAGPGTTEVPTAGGAISAGAAPGEPPAPSVTVEQDPDAPTYSEEES